MVARLDKTFTDYGMQISAEKTKLMTNSNNGITKDIMVQGVKLDTVSRFKYLCVIVTDEGSKPEVLARIAQTATAITNPQLKDQTDALFGHVHFPVCMRDMDIDS